METNQVWEKKPGGTYDALESVWETIFCKRPRVRWCKFQVLEFKPQLDKLFEGRAAEGEFAMSSNNLLQTPPSFHLPLDSRLSSQESQPRGKQTYLEEIDEGFGGPRRTFK